MQLLRPTAVHLKFRRFRFVQNRCETYKAHILSSFRTETLDSSGVLLLWSALSSSFPAKFTGGMGRPRRSSSRLHRFKVSVLGYPRKRSLRRPNWFITSLISVFPKHSDGSLPDPTSPARRDCAAVRSRACSFCVLFLHHGSSLGFALALLLWFLWERYLSPLFVLGNSHFIGLAASRQHTFTHQPLLQGYKSGSGVGSKPRRMVPVGPLRCLAMIRSAVPAASLCGL